jgi:hypothetical protein
MFNQIPPEKTGLEKAIDGVLSEMDGVSADSDEFEKMTDQLVKLHAMKTQESRPRISPDVKATIAANLAGILVIVGHERTHIVTSKALGFIKKLW